MQSLGEQCKRQGIDYCSLGTIQAHEEDALDSKRALWEMQADFVAGTPNIFTSVQVGTSHGKRINLDAVRGAAATMKSLSTCTEDGFGNLRFAAAANCPPHVPFFPAAYYLADERNRGGPEFGLALEAADLAVQAFGMASSPEEARANLLALLTDHCDLLAQVCGNIAAETGYTFTGLDISMAPFPDESRSTGGAIELLSGVPVGAPGTLAAMTLFTGVLREARNSLPTVGYSGVMLPVLEDQTLADRAAEGLVTVETLLLLSAVCGLGLDTVPLPGDVSNEQLERIILDMAALAIRLDKPLTARLFPVPGKAAGEPAVWPDFPFFARGSVIGVPGGGEEGKGLFRGDWLQI